MENSLKALLLAAGVIITCIVVSLGFYISREGRDTANKGVGQMSKLNAEFNESDKVMYDGMDISGSEVLNIVNKFKNEELGVVVTTKKGTMHYIYTVTGTTGNAMLSGKSSASVKEAQKPTSGTYVNPNEQFSGEVLRDANNTIVGLQFVQK